MLKARYYHQLPIVPIGSTNDLDALSIDTSAVRSDRIRIHSIVRDYIFNYSCNDLCLTTVLGDGSKDWLPSTLHEDAFQWPKLRAKQLRSILDPL
jgi:hypothetical protein